MFCVEELCQFGMRGKIGVLKRLHLVLKVGMCIEMRREILKLAENILFFDLCDCNEPGGRKKLLPLFLVLFLEI